jgi:hypothetical protein
MGRSPIFSTGLAGPPFSEAAPLLRSLPEAALAGVAAYHPCQARFDLPEIHEPLSFLASTQIVRTHLYSKQYFVRGPPHLCALLQDRKTRMPRSIYHALSSPVLTSQKSPAPFVCCPCTLCTYTSVFQYLFCSPNLRHAPGPPSANKRGTMTWRQAELSDPIVRTKLTVTCSTWNRCSISRVRANLKFPWPSRISTCPPLTA